VEGEPAIRSQKAVLSVIILTYNEEANLPACLKSLRGLECEVFVVDSGSTDRTVEIAKAAGATVVVHPFEHYAAQRNWAQSHLPLSNEWVLHIDAGERVTPELAESLSRFFSSGPPDEIDGLLVVRRTIFLGRWLRHGAMYPVYHLRAFRKNKGWCEDRQNDQHFVVDGNVHKLNGDLLDTITEDLDSWTLRHVRWARLEADELMRRRPVGSSSGVRARLNGNPIERRRWLRNIYYRMPLFVRALGFFCYHYFFRLGFLDGIEGLIFWTLRGFWYRFYLDAKLYEARRRSEVEQAPGG